MPTFDAEIDLENDKNRILLSSTIALKIPYVMLSKRAPI